MTTIESVRSAFRRHWRWLLLAVLTAALFAWLLAPRPLEVELVPLRVGRFERSIDEDGKTRLRERYLVSAPVAGRLGRVTLREGDTVSHGQVLAQIWPVEPALLDARRLQEQREQVAAMEANLSRSGATVARAKAALAEAEADMARTESLVGRGFVSGSQADHARTAVELRRRELEAASSEATAARHQLAQLRIALQRDARADPLASRPYAVRAPVAGRVLRVQQQSEAVVASGTPLLEIGDPAQMEVLVDLLTEDAAQLSPGAPARLSNWGGATVLAARVRRIEPSAFTKVSALGVEEQRVHVILDIASPASAWVALGDQFRVDVSLPVQVAEDAQLVPASSVFPSGREAAMFVAEHGRARRVAVTLVARNGRDAWIRSTLAAGTAVITYPPASLRDGQRVSALPR